LIARGERYDVQAVLAVGVALPGSVTLQPAALAGTNLPVLGVAARTGSDGESDPSARPFAVLHKNVVVPFGPVTLNSALAGIVRHADAVETIPRSSDHRPPGVCG
jgi:hypothetical protein